VKYANISCAVLIALLVAAGVEGKRLSSAALSAQAEIQRDVAIKRHTMRAITE